MKIFFFTIACAALVIFSGCSGSRTVSGPASTNTTDTTFNNSNDKAVVYKEIKGKWDVVSMNRTGNAEPEAVPGVFITLADSSFGGKAPCNHIGGEYALKGNNAISFNDIISTKMACERSDQENAFLNLLEKKVTSFTVNDTSLLLKDNANHVVLECRKEK